MKTYIVFLILALSVSLSSCKTKKELNSINVNDTITVVVKDSVKIDLVSNPSTGYKWECIDNSAEKKLIFVDDVYTAPNGNLTGAAGKQTFTYFAKKKGSVLLKFEYIRNGTQTKTHYVLVIIEKK